MDPQSPIRSITIVGGGTAGWMTAALLSRAVGGLYDISLVESDDIGIIGVGEATIPAIKIFNRMVQLDDTEMMRATKATFKLGIEFVDWREKGHSYVHGFGKIGSDLMWLRTHQLWLALGGEAGLGSFDDFSINTLMSRRNKFEMPKNSGSHSPLADIDFAYHFDAALYGQYLRGLSEQRGVKRIEGRIVSVNLRQDDGFVDHLVLASGQVVGGDLFVDCSGQRGLIIEQALKSGFEDWSHWLLCDRALAVPCASAEVLTPYTRSTARDAGWQWRIPLQHRIGNGHVYSSAYISDQAAADVLLANLDGAPLAEPRMVKFTPGKRRQGWVKNCISVGLASGFLEPLESTSIHLIQTSILRLLALFPHKGFNAVEIKEYNRQNDYEYTVIRDFIIAHYKVTNRDDTPFWAYCKNMAVPEALAERLNLFASSARFFKRNEELFAEESWVQVLLGQGFHADHDPNVAIIPPDDLRAHMQEVREVIAHTVDAMPTHQVYIDRLMAG